ncbi:hypothetical protein VTH82DRAFT_2971 [Thermothelomyces myriococcoides]
MKTTVSAVLAFAAAVLAKPVITNSSFNVEKGKPFTVTYTGCENGCTITLKKGDPENLETVEVLTTQATGNSFTWTPTDDLDSDRYAFEIKDESGETNYSQMWNLDGDDSSSTASESATATETVTSSASSVSATSTTESTSGTSTETETETETETSTSTSASSTETETETETSTSTESSTSTTLSTSTTTTESTSTSARPTFTNINGDDNEDAAPRAFTSPLGLVLVTVAALMLFN